MDTYFFPIQCIEYLLYNLHNFSKKVWCEAIATSVHNLQVSTFIHSYLNRHNFRPTHVWDWRTTLLLAPVLPSRVKGTIDAKSTERERVLHNWRRTMFGIPINCVLHAWCHIVSIQILPASVALVSWFRRRSANRRTRVWILTSNFALIILTTIIPRYQPS